MNRVDHSAAIDPRQQQKNGSPSPAVIESDFEANLGVCDLRLIYRVYRCCGMNRATLTCKRDEFRSYSRPLAPGFSLPPTGQQPGRPLHDMRRLAVDTTRPTYSTNTLADAAKTAKRAPLHCVRALETMWNEAPDDKSALQRHDKHQKGRPLPCFRALAKAANKAPGQ